MLLSVCLSVRPSRTWQIIREPRGLACPNLERRFPTLDATRIPVSRPKGQRSESPGPLMLTYTVRHILRMARPTNFKLGVYGWRTTTRISRRRYDLQDQRSRSHGHVISLNRVGPMAHKSKTKSRTITKIGRDTQRHVLHCTPVSTL